ncbi:MAG TPA: hypothetical protein VFV49_02235 [Thermoanaerobaculia bacterium]|nr:hypothetical protein [Thermoanaerobaculia bacterium]
MNDRYHELFERLRKARFPVGPDQYLRMRQLLVVVGEREDHRLKTLLTPIFAGSREQQQQFYEIFDEMFTATWLPEAERGEELKEPPPPMRRRNVWTVIGAIVLIGVLYAALHTYTSRHQPQPVPRPPQPAVLRIYQKVTKFVLQRLPSLSAKTIAAVLALALLAAVIVAIVIQEWRRRRRRPDRGQEPLFEWSIHAPSPPHLFDPVELLRLARALKGREEVEQKRLHVRKTILATVRSGGDPRLVYQSAFRVPEYIMLIEKRGERDHQAIWFDRLASALAAEDVPVTRYWFEGDPRLVWSTSQRQRLRLRDLRHRWPEARLLICTDPAALLDPITGELLANLAAELEWKRQIVVTLSPVRRAVAEKLKRRVELIAGIDVLERLTERITGSIHRAEPSPEPLSEDACRWLRACAAHPQLEWDLTLALGAAIAGPRFGFVIRELLPMRAFRRGAMQTSERLALVEELAADRELERTARGIVKQLLGELVLPPNSFAAREVYLQRIGQEIWLQRDSPQALHEIYGDLREFRIAEIGRDPALLRLLSSAPGTRILRHIPRRLRQLWFRSGIPALGHHDLAGATAGVVVLVLILAGTPWKRLRTATGAPVQQPYPAWELRIDTMTTETTATFTVSTDTMTTATTATTVTTATTATTATTVTSTDTTLGPVFPIYVTPKMLYNCRTRGDTCGGRDVTLAGVYFERGVIRTQTCETCNGHSEVSFDIPSGALRLLFAVGNPYTGGDCGDPTKTGMLLFVEVDGIRTWEGQVQWRGTALMGEVPLAKDARRIKLVGNTSDGTVDCDDSVWAGVRFE